MTFTLLNISLNKFAQNIVSILLLSFKKIFFFWRKKIKKFIL